MEKPAVVSGGLLIGVEDRAALFVVASPAFRRYAADDNQGFGDGVIAGLVVHLIEAISKGLIWSEWRDSNSRPSGPKPDALPGCATLRRDV